VDFKNRLTHIIHLPSKKQTEAIDVLYSDIMAQAFHCELEPYEEPLIGQMLSAVVFLQVPLSVDAITSLLNMDRSLGSNFLEPFRPVIHLPAAGSVSIFHASFHDFVVTPSRCEKHHLNVFEGHRMLAVQSLQCLNSSLKHNICNLDINVNYSPSDEPHAIHDSLQYACVYWASHLANALERVPVDPR
jgi:hypothetical protein